MRKLSQTPQVWRGEAAARVPLDSSDEGVDHRHLDSEVRSLIWQRFTRELVESMHRAWRQQNG